MGSKSKVNSDIRKSLPSIASVKSDGLQSAKNKWKSGIDSIASTAQDLLDLGDSPVRPNMERRGAITDATKIKPGLLSAIQNWRHKSVQNLSDLSSPSRKSSDWQLMKRGRSEDRVSFGSPSKSVARFLNKEVSSEKKLWTSHPWSQALKRRTVWNRPSTKVNSINWTWKEKNHLTLMKLVMPAWILVN